MPKRPRRVRKSTTRWTSPRRIRPWPRLPPPSKRPPRLLPPSRNPLPLRNPSRKAWPDFKPARESGLFSATAPNAGRRPRWTG
ncbi:hypothetical protein ESB00_11920 [Oleiharenicola lentus]|uniref:Uncharacterized protein n=1 Tax=Oleiharenicola lentus TaxID=2508720 RepID=A0A4Q1CD08_9BACT|nr:hypothetical protein ESB00_11920 [Oleiharenicola lentus]